MTLRTLNNGNFGIFLVMGNAGFMSSTISLSVCTCINLGFKQLYRSKEWIIPYSVQVLWSLALAALWNFCQHIEL